ncbi:PAS domain S-box-containing protein [Anaerospora hongkongensis]|uniref:PAS domain S-box-containing protein n=2 Tax=Anaerospora hongkongensis TaxID=244830 RepID=A0A4R1Q390_9FIRM|nr:PAS domain S-box-containing protein [Anaerospora hongkongensis]
MQMRTNVLSVFSGFSRKKKSGKGFMEAIVEVVCTQVITVLRCNMYINNIINRKAAPVSAEMTLAEAADAFKRLNVDGFPVINQMGSLVGMLTKTHIVNAITEPDFFQRQVKDVMEKDVFFLHVFDDVKKVQQKDGFYQRELIPVVDDNNFPVGIVSQADFMRFLSEDATFLAEEILAVINSTCNGVIAINAEGIITLFNHAAEHITGIKAAHSVGRCIDDVIPGSGLRQVLKMGSGITNQQHVVGSCKVLTNLSPIRKGNKILGAVNVFQDITELQSVAAELESVKDLKSILESVVESLFEGIVVVDKNGIITMLNQAYGDFLGIDATTAIGHPATDIIPNTRMHLVVQNRKAEIGDVQRIGDNNVVVTRIPIIKDGEITGAVGKVLFKDVKDLRTMANKLNKLQSELEYYKEELHKTYGGKYTIESIISRSEKMEWLKTIAAKAAKGHSTVLLLGESGTGKELFAHAIHQGSPRRNGPFIKVNCAAIPEPLLESELFGYEDGAFTGARRGGKPGKFELANGGTIFLDEIGDMTMSMQVKLLRVLQEKEVERLGGTNTSTVDVRVITATNKELEQLVKQGKFRPDLYYRLNIISLSLPPLRERYEDIPLLCNVLLQKISNTINTSIKGISPAVMKLFTEYSWPGNVRELENVLERSVNLMDDEEFIMLEHLPPTIKKSYKVAEETAADIYSVLENAERQAICKALEAMEGNKSKAAQLLGLHRSGFYKRLKKYNIMDNE